MRRLFFIFLFVPFLAFTQTKDYKSFDIDEVEVVVSENFNLS